MTYITFLRKIGCYTRIEAENISIRYLEIYFTNVFEILFDDGACLAKNDTYHEILKNVLLSVGLFYSNLGLKQQNQVSRDIIYKYFANFT